MSWTEVAIIGAGPYGLSIAAHLRHLGIPFRIFGVAMQSWRYRMPVGMHLKSEGFASDIFDPDSSFTLARYSAERGLPYRDVAYPIPLETFARYGMEFQKRLVPELEETNVTMLTNGAHDFTLRTASNLEIRARRVVLAVGITHFAYIPPTLSSLPPGYVTHSSEHHDTARFRGRSVAIVGAGASAVDLAGLMHQAGADVRLVARRNAIKFHRPPIEPRPWLERLIHPRSALGPGWRSLLCAEAPLLFHTLPWRLRLLIVRRHLGPAPGWFVRDLVVGRMPVYLGATPIQAAVRGNQVELVCTHKDRDTLTLTVDHLIAGTGYRVAMRRLDFLGQEIRRRLRTVDDSPVLSRNFESSVPGLFVVGLAAANSFGPLMRFACGARFAARRLIQTLTR